MIAGRLRQNGRVARGRPDVRVSSSCRRTRRRGASQGAPQRRGATRCRGLVRARRDSASVLTVDFSAEARQPLLLLVAFVATAIAIFLMFVQPSG